MAMSRIPPKASALFSHHELQEYKEWRFPEYNIAVLDDDHVLLPTAFEYADFLDWRAAQRMRRFMPPVDSKDEDANYFGGKANKPEYEGFTLADRCGHPLHPGYYEILHEFDANDNADEEGEEGEEGELDDLPPWCPMCSLGKHLKLLAELWDKWLEVGGPWRALPPGTTGDQFVFAKRAYYQHKVGLVNAMDGVEDIARLEAAWEVEHPAVDIEVVKAFGARKAVQTYSKGISFPAQLAEVKQALPSTPPRTKKHKRLSYSPGTPEETRSRPNACYARRCTSYDPDSPHACPDEEGWAETSFKNDWEYNVRQCRLLHCDKDPSLPNVTYRELFDEECKDVLVNGINSWFNKMDPSWIPLWQNSLLATTEIFLVWRDEKCPEGNDCFNNWEKVETLVGTNLEAYARRIGDMNEEESAEQQALPEFVLQSTQREDEDFFNQESLASDTSSEDEDEDEDEEEEEDGWADHTDVEEDDDNTVVDVEEGDGPGEVDDSASTKGG